MIKTNNPIIKPRLIILTDLWGTTNASWIDLYKELLNPQFDVLIYDSCKLAGIDATGLSEKQRHSHFIDFGIETAVKELLRLEQDPLNILGYSIGGTIAWKAGLKGLQIIHLYAISATRLRFEIEKPDCKIVLLFGEHDTYSPHLDWALNLDLTLKIIKDGEHKTYMDPKTIKKVCGHLKSVTVKNNE